MDCTYKNNIGTFNYRVGAIIINEGKILMVKSYNNNYYYSVGGRVTLFETMDEAVIREVFEETGINVGIDRLFLIHENYFKLDDKDKYHELCIYYLMKPIDNIENINKFLIEKDIKEKLEWLDLENIKDYNIYPEFLKEEKIFESTSILKRVSRKI